MSNTTTSTAVQHPAAQHRTVFLDFETYYDTEVSLKKIIAPLYVKHPKFHVIMMAVATNGSEPEWYRMEEIPEALAKLKLDAEGTVVVCHNAQFDGCVLEYYYGVHPWRYACTVAMAQVSGMALVAGGGSLALLSEYLTKTFNTPHSKGHEVSNMVGVRAQDMDEAMWGLYAKYCMDDVRLARSIYMATVPSISKSEMRLISETITMTTRPVFKFDSTLLAAYSQEVEDKFATALTNLQRATGRTTNEAVARYINSDNNFATLLRSYGVTPPQKISLAKVKRQSTQSSLDGFDNEDSTLVFAFSKSDQKFLDLAATHPNETVREVCGMRLEVKSGLLRTRAKSLLALANAGIAPMPLRYASAHTGRYGGGMKINVQNLPRGSLRRSLISREGWVVLSADSSQIEARLNAYIADQQDMLDIFRRGEDLYCHMGAALGGMTYEELFHIAKVAPTEHGAFLRKLGKVTELACGYQMGAAKFADNLALQGIELPDGMSAEGVVNLYRTTKDKITAAWAFNGKVVLKRLFDGDVFTFGGPDGKLFKANGSDTLFGQPCATVQLPDGYKLKYYKLEREADPATGYTQYTYLGKDNADGGFMRKKIYAGLMQENCIAEGSLVLTDSGWKPIEHVSTHDLIFDGDTWVSHNGVVMRSEQQCIAVDGVYMTEDHEVLDEQQKWVCASQQPRPYRPDIRGVVVPREGVHGREKMVLGVQMRMRKRMCKSRLGGAKSDTKRVHSELWVFNACNPARPAHSTWNVRAPALRGVARDESTVYKPKPQGVEELRGARNNRVRRVARGVRALFSGHGGKLRKWNRPRQDKQRARVLERELPLGVAEGKHVKQAQLPWVGHDGAESIVRGTKVNTMLPTGQGPRRFRVYDILNCGPKTRFVVKGETGPMIVHNCTQALAFAVIKWQGLQIIRLSKGLLRLGLNVHDEWVTTCRVEDIDIAVPVLFEAMTKVPPWLEGCPLDCEVDIGYNYQDMTTL